MVTKVFTAALVAGAVAYGAYRLAGQDVRTESDESPAESTVGAIREADFQSQVIESGLPVGVDFYAPWCGPCRMLAPTLNQLAAAYDGKVRFVKVNVDRDAALAGKYGVQGVPTLLFFKGGKTVDSTVGLQSAEALRIRLDRLAASAPKGTNNSKEGRS
jgi:thioredoxin 1